MIRSINVFSYYVRAYQLLNELLNGARARIGCFRPPFKSIIERPFVERDEAQFVELTGCLLTDVGYWRIRRRLREMVMRTGVPVGRSNRARTVNRWRYVLFI